jgi:hypothetical protein
MVTVGILDYNFWEQFRAQETPAVASKIPSQTKGSLADGAD